MPPTDPWAIGRGHELQTDPQARKQRGAWYTPRWVAEIVVVRALDGRPLPSFIVDPACGGGAFVLATLDGLVARGRTPAAALASVGAIDIDDGAVETTREAVGAWAAQQGVPGAVREVRFAVADALGPWPSTWPDPDLVVGNPPFATPLRGAPVPPEVEQRRTANPELFGPYADVAAVHFHRAVEATEPRRGRVAMVLPQSLLAARDVGGWRRHLTTTMHTCAVWATAEQPYDASVRVWAPVLAHRAGSEPVEEVSWAEQVAGELGAPDVVLPTGTGTLADLAEIGAGFRDEYYGLADACIEGRNGDVRPALTTVGSIDPLWCWWGERPIRFARKVWDRPVIDIDRLSGSVRAWCERQQRPKVLLPTQSKVFEPFVDERGAHVGVTPVISLVPADDDHLHAIAAVLLAPPVVAASYRRWFGTALSVDAIKVAARDVASLPLPVDGERWRAAAALVPEGPSALPSIAATMTDAYDADRSLLEWWSARRPQR